MTMLYIVWPHEDVTDEHHGSHWIHEDTDSFIRRRLEVNKTNWDPENFQPYFVKPWDPLEYLYTGTVYNGKDADGNDMAETLGQSDMVRSAQTKPDGTTLLEVGSQRAKVTAYHMEYPKEPLFGVPGHFVAMAGQKISIRRPVTNRMAPDLIQLFHSVVPDTTRLHELEALSKTSNEKMLLLGDALMSGVHGWPRDVDRACACYRAAAWGCQESEEASRLGTMVGLPEAMMESASVVMGFLKVKLLGLDPWDNVQTSRVFEVALQTEGGTFFLCQLLFYTHSALCRGYVTPLTLDLARAAKEMNLARDRRLRDEEEIQEFVEHLYKAWEYRMLEISFEELLESGTIPRGDPDDTTLELFASKIDVIFPEIPVASFVMHLEYRQIPRVPFPIVVYAIVPQKKKVLKVVRLPEDLQISAFSIESFRYVWLRVAFALHLGDAATGGRKRPTEITVLDSPGNRQFASFLRDALSNFGTPIRSVTHSETIGWDNSCRRGKRERYRELGSIIIQQIENPLLEIPNYLIEEGSDASATASELQQRFLHQHVNEIAARIGNDLRQSLLRTEELKSQGNSLFSTSDFVGAIRCYSIAIELLRLLPEPNDETHLMLGTLLSNRAACYIDLEAQRSSSEFQKLLLRNAVSDCTVALKSSWASRVLTVRIRDKLKFRRDKASARLDVLQCEFESEVVSWIFPESSSSNRNATREEGETGNDSVPAQPLGEQVDPGRVKDRVVGENGRDMLLEEGQTIFDSRLAKNFKDGCPICLRECNGELSHSYCAVLPCGEHVLCAECICTMKKNADKEKADLACPLCRHQFNGQIVQDLAYEIIERDQGLAIVVEKFPAGFEESIAVAYSLLWKKDFRVDEVIETLDGILDDRASGLFFRTKGDLTHEQKDEIYQRARLPVRRLQEKLDKLVEERRTTFETLRLADIDVALRTVRSDLSTARRKARDEVYETLNSVGNMGAQDDSSDSGNIQVDYHGLHVGEMLAKYEELVEAILPVVKRVIVVTGRGLHSAKGSPKLQKALRKKIDKDQRVRWERDPQNPGVLVVKWTANNSDA